MVIFKGEWLNYEWTRQEVPNTEYGMSLQGWTDHELFMNGYRVGIVHLKYSTL